MKRATTQQLIDRLVADVTPWRPLRSPAQRAGTWLCAFFVAALALVWLFGSVPVLDLASRDGRLALELVVTLMTGMGGVLAAFFLSVPDRSRLWFVLPLLPMCAWIVLSCLGCYAQWLATGGDSWELGESLHCLVFVVGVGIPTSLALYWAVRAASPLTPKSTLAAGGLGVAALAAFLLRFFHPFEVTFLDLGLHVVAIALVFAITAIGGSAALARQLKRVPVSRKRTKSHRA